jgi:hypothetical protein
LIISAIILLLRNAPFGEAFWAGIPVIGDWVDKYPSSGVSAAWFVILGLASIVLITRIILGQEKRVLGGLE